MVSNDNSSLGTQLAGNFPQVGREIQQSLGKATMGIILPHTGSEMATHLPKSPDSLLRFFDKNRNERFFLNADHRSPMTIHRLGTDYVQFHNLGKDDEVIDIITIPLTSIVSVQERSGLGGIVVYLVR